MEIFSFDESKKNEYMNFVATQESGSFLQSWGWGDFQESQGKETIRIGVSDGGKTIGTVQLLKIKIPHLNGHYLYAPYGPLIAEGASKEASIKTLTDYLAAHYADSWFFRFEPNTSLPLPGRPTQRIQPGKTLMTDISQQTPDLLSKMHPKTRYNIKVAAKHGVTINTAGENLEVAISQLTKTSSRQNYHSYPAGYYDSLIRFFRRDMQDCKVSLYSAMYGDELAACAVMVDHGHTRTYLFGGSNDKLRNIMAPYALHWQAIADAKAKGFTKYDWWGIETATGKLPGFVQFKLKWGGEQIAYPPAMDIIQSSLKYRAYSLLRKLNRLF
jgi:lipid II:glycine glycyltransferase (peptidoglycan interpeptide bridge formation enzyme)